MEAKGRRPRGRVARGGHRAAAGACRVSAPRDPTLIVAGGSGPRGGRPRVATEECVSLSAWIPVSQYSMLCKMAQVRDVSVSALVRELLRAYRIPHRR